MFLKDLNPKVGDKFIIETRSTFRGEIIFNGKYKVTKIYGGGDNGTKLIVLRQGFFPLYLHCTYILDEAEFYSITRV